MCLMAYDIIRYDRISSIRVCIIHCVEEEKEREDGGEGRDPCARFF